MVTDLAEGWGSFTMLKNDIITLEPADPQNVDLLVRWTLDPVAQGPYKRVPPWTADEVRDVILHSPDRQYFLIRRTADGEPLGRFYYRAWRFSGAHDTVDWELNILIADPAERGKGYGTAAQRLALDHLLHRPETRSVFAYTFAANRAERRSLEKCGLQERGSLPHPYYRVKLPPEESVLYVRDKREAGQRTRPTFC
jgi:RimJ/RimL family protein N-acetyltransferase